MYSEPGRAEKEVSVRWETGRMAIEKAKEWLKQWGFEDPATESAAFAPLA